MNNLRKFAFTFFWQEIFPDYETFKDFTDELELYSENDTISENFNQYLYSILTAHFFNNNVRYDTIESFKSAFSIAYVNNFKLLKKRTELLEKQFEITEEEFSIITRNIVNSAFNPNNAVDNPLEPIEYVSAQNYSVGIINKLNAFINAINTMQDLDIEFIIKKFEYLFVQILPETDMVYIFDDEEN